jgi:hypothetical protein
MDGRHTHLYALTRAEVPPAWRIRTHREPVLGQVQVLATVDPGYPHKSRWAAATFPGEPDERRDQAIAVALGQKIRGT